MNALRQLTPGEETTETGGGAGTPEDVEAREGQAYHQGVEASQIASKMNRSSHLIKAKRKMTRLNQTVLIMRQKVVLIPQLCLSWRKF